MPEEIEIPKNDDLDLDGLKEECENDLDGEFVEKDDKFICKVGEGI